MIRCCVFVLVAGSCLAAVADETDKRLLPLCNELGDRVSDEQWKQVAKLITVLQENIEDHAGDLPYEKPAQMARPKLLTSLPNAARGRHSLWRDARFSSRLAPPMDGYIHTTAVVLNSNLSRKPASESRPRSSRYDPNIAWDGYINKSVVIVNGAIELDSYIADSIVIALGPIRIRDGYISNSLVVSCYDGDETAVDVSKGYVSHAIIVAKTCKPGSARQCIIFGKTDTDDVRGAQLRDWREVAAVVRGLGADGVQLPKLERPIKPSAPNSERLLEKLLAAEELTLCNQIANLLAEFRLNADQVQRLIEAAQREKSDAKRTVLWHAIRQSRDLAGRRFLTKTIVEDASAEQQIVFLQTLKNPAPFDVPVLAELYRTYRPKFDPQDSREQLSDLGDQFMRFATRPGRELMGDARVPEELGFLDSAHWRSISDRRGDEAHAARHELLRWLVRNGARDQHRLDAWKAVINPRWPRSRDMTDARQINSDLLNSSEDPNFRAKAVELLGNHMEPSWFLNDEEPTVVRLAAIKAIAQKTGAAWKGYSTARHTYVRQYTAALKEVVETDKEKSVRDAASALLAKFTRWQSEK